MAGHERWAGANTRTAEGARIAGGRRADHAGERHRAHRDRHRVRRPHRRCPRSSPSCVPCSTRFTSGTTRAMFPGCVWLRLGGVPYLAAKWDSPALRRTLRRELRASAADVVYVDHLGMARYLPDIRAERPGSRIVLDQHNVESDLFKQFAERQDRGERTRCRRGVASDGALRAQSARALSTPSSRFPGRTNATSRRSPTYRCTSCQS